MNAEIARSGYYSYILPCLCKKKETPALQTEAVASSTSQAPRVQTTPPATEQRVTETVATVAATVLPPVVQQQPAPVVQQPVVEQVVQQPVVRVNVEEGVIEIRPRGVQPPVVEQQPAEVTVQATIQTEQAVVEANAVVPVNPNSSQNPANQPATGAGKKREQCIIC